MEDLVKKIGHRIGEVSDRAVRSLHSKLNTGLCNVDDVLEVENGAVAALLLHWINERQSQADVQALNAALKMLLDISKTSRGCGLLQGLQAVEFLNAYYKYVPSTLQMTVTSILNSLISPSVQAEVQSKEDYIPINLEYLEKSKLPPKPEENSDKPCEFPPVLLCESDEKLLFDATVTLKFGSSEEILQICSDLNSRILKDFPAEIILQHGDLIRSLVGLVQASTSKKLPTVGNASLGVLASFIRKLGLFYNETRKAEYRPASLMGKKILAKSEYLELSNPCLKPEQYEIGTPGPTFSVFFAVEFVITELPIDYVELAAGVLDVWIEAEWFYPSLTKFPSVINKMVAILANGIGIMGTEYPIFTSRLVHVAEILLVSLPAEVLRHCLSRNSKILQYLAEFSLFQYGNTCKLLSHLETVDPDLLGEFRYAESCVQAIEGLKTMTQIMMNQEILPILSMSSFSKAVDFFKNIVPALEFSCSSSLISSILDLNCYSLFIEKSATSGARRNECINLVLALLSSPLPSITSQTLMKIEENLDTDCYLLGIGKDAKRQVLLKEVILESSLISVLVTKYKEPGILIKLMKEPEDYEKLVPFFTILASWTVDEIEPILHMVSICNPALTPLRFFRDLFSSSTSRRAVAVTVLRGSASPEVIQDKWKSLVEEMWERNDLPDPVQTLAGVPELSTLSSIKTSLSSDELSNLLNIFKSPTLESNLKVSAAEQILVQLFSGLSSEAQIDDLLVSAINNLTKDTDDRYTKRLISKSLQIIVLIGLKYESKAKKLYTSSVKFMCSLIPYIFSTYDQIRHYSLQLLYILSFSNLTQRNKFINSELFTLVPDSALSSSSTSQLSVPVLSILFPGYIKAFETNMLYPEWYSEEAYIKLWKNVPSSARVKHYVSKASKLVVDPDQLLDQWARQLNQAESHKHILQVTHDWVNTVKVALQLPGNLDWKLVRPNNDLVMCLANILKAPPVNSSEDGLHIALQQMLRAVVSLMSESCKVHLEFISLVSSIVSKTCIPFISELSELVTRKPLVLSVLSLVQSILPFHGATLEGDRTLFVLSKHQLEPGPLSFLSLLSKILETIDDISILEYVFKTLTSMIDHPQVEVSIDLSTSPLSQKSIQSIARQGVCKLPPFVNSNTFVYKSAAKAFLQFLIRVQHLIELDSWMWCIRFSEDRDAGLRTLAWAALSQKAIEVYSLHNSVLDIALEVVFGLKEAYGVKIHACKFLCGLAEFLLNSEDSVHKAGILKAFYQFSVISQVKTLMYENSGPPPVYFAVLLSLLNSLVVLDSAKVIPICIQIDVFEGILRILRPGALEERAKNEVRKPFKDLDVLEFEQVLLALISICTFFNNVIRNDIQVLDYLLETSHFIGFIMTWIDTIVEKFDHTQEILYSKTLLGFVNVLHMSLFKSIKTKRHLQDFSFEKLAKIMEMTQSKDLKLASTRFLTSLLASIPSSDCSKILLHLISLFKSTEVLSEHKEILKSLTSLLFHDESSKLIAVQTGFAETLYNLSLDLIGQVNSSDLQKSRKKEEDTSILKQLIDYIILFKLWSSNSYSAKLSLSIKDGRAGVLMKLLFSCWPLALRKEELLKTVLETLCTVISSCEEAKKACAIVQESRQSLLSYIIEYISRPNSASEACFHVSLKILGSLCSCKESRQLLIKSKYPQGLALRLVKEWNEIKNIEEVPKRSPFIIEFLTNFAFFPEGQKVISGITGLVDVLVELLERFSKNALGWEPVEQSLLLLRNLSFSNSNKVHFVANQKALPIILSYISAPDQKPRMRKLASSTLWALLYHYQKFKAILNNEQVIEGLERVYKEVTRDSERAKDQQIMEDLKAVSENLNSVLKICMGN